MVLKNNAKVRPAPATPSPKIHIPSANSYPSEEIDDYFEEVEAEEKAAAVEEDPRNVEDFPGTKRPDTCRTKPFPFLRSKCIKFERICRIIFIASIVSDATMGLFEAAVAAHSTGGAQIARKVSQCALVLIIGQVGSVILVLEFKKPPEYLRLWKFHIYFHVLSMLSVGVTLALDGILPLVLSDRKRARRHERLINILSITLFPLYHIVVIYAMLFGYAHARRMKNDVIDGLLIIETEGVKDLQEEIDMNLLKSASNDGVEEAGIMSDYFDP